MLTSDLNDGSNDTTPSKHNSKQIPVGHLTSGLRIGAGEETQYKNEINTKGRGGLASRAVSIGMFLSNQEEVLVERFAAMPSDVRKAYRLP